MLKSHPWFDSFECKRHWILLQMVLVGFEKKVNRSSWFGSDSFCQWQRAFVLACRRLLLGKVGLVLSTTVVVIGK